MREKSGEWKMIKIYYMKKIVQLGGDKHRALGGGELGGEEGAETAARM